MNPQTVRITYLRQIADQAAELGVDTVAWLAISGLKEDDLADASAVVAVETFGELVANAIRLSESPRPNRLIKDMKPLNLHLGIAVNKKAQLMVHVHELSKGGV